VTYDRPTITREGLQNPVGGCGLRPDGFHVCYGNLILPRSGQNESVSDHNRKDMVQKRQIRSGVGRRYAKPAIFGRRGRIDESRVIAATITLESSCMVETSRWSKAQGVEESTSKTPKVRR
jgi:hypothetical protein